MVNSPKPVTARPVRNGRTSTSSLRAIIREPTTTVVVHPGSTATVTELGNYLLEVDLERREGAVFVGAAETS